MTQAGKPAIIYTLDDVGGPCPINGRPYGQNCGPLEKAFCLRTAASALACVPSLSVRPKDSDLPVPTVVWAGSLPEARRERVCMYTCTPLRVCVGYSLCFSEDPCRRSSSCLARSPFLERSSEYLASRGRAFQPAPHAPKGWMPP